MEVDLDRQIRHNNEWNKRDGKKKRSVPWPGPLIGHIARRRKPHWSWLRNGFEKEVKRLAVPQDYQTCSI